METKFTPGPWAVANNSIGHPYVCTHRDNEQPKDWHPDEYSATICSYLGDHTETRTAGSQLANAHLIAAAPDLYEALEYIANTLPHHAGQTPNEFHFQEVAKKALAKARGESC